jgi:hypothetical protein
MSAGIPIDEEAKNCGVWVVNIIDGTHVGTFRFTQGVHEIFAVQALRGVRYPDLLDKTDPVALQTYFLPPSTLNPAAAPGR